MLLRRGWNRRPRMKEKGPWQRADWIRQQIATWSLSEGKIVTPAVLEEKANHRGASQ